MKSRQRIPQKIIAELQKEIGSKCPFCSNSDVGSFEKHHIDENSENNDPENLIMLCSTCHTKIEKGYISQEAVIKKKLDLKNKYGNIEFELVTIDERECNWTISPTNEFAFYFRKRSKSNYPILNFTMTNHLNKTVVFNSIEVKAKSLFSGISGPPPPAEVLYPVHRYSMEIHTDGRIRQCKLLNPISIPANESFLFQLELYQINWEGKMESFKRCYAMDFTFNFSAREKVKAPTILFNAENDSNTVTLSVYR